MRTALPCKGQPLSPEIREYRRDLLCASCAYHHAPAAWSRNKMVDMQSRIVASVFCHAFDSFATHLGTILRGIQRCAKTLNLLIAPGTARPPPLARTRSVSSTTCSVLRSEERRVGKECRSRWA